MDGGRCRGKKDVSSSSFFVIFFKILFPAFHTNTNYNISTMLARPCFFPVFCLILRTYLQNLPHSFAQLTNTIFNWIQRLVCFCFGETSHTHFPSLIHSSQNGRKTQATLFVLFCLFVFFFHLNFFAFLGSKCFWAQEIERWEEEPNDRRLFFKFIMYTERRWAKGGRGCVGGKEEVTPFGHWALRTIHNLTC